MKKILMIATGGTIASKRSENGLSPQMTSDEILAYVPKVREFCQVSELQLMNIDSTNVTPDDWVKMARAIRDNYDLYDGFVLCHGTDTMAYTAAVLSFLIPQSPKPIVITGAQKPIDMEVTDARTNLFDSFLYCSSDFACGVSVVFDGKVINGARAKKMYSKSYNAFSSINYPHVAVISGGKIIRYIDKKYDGKPVFYDELNPNVGLFKLIPGAKPEILDYYFKLHDAVVVESFGAGGIPDVGDEEFYKVIEKWQKQGKVLVMCTQVVNEGSDMTVYKVGKSLKEKYGFLESYDMTLESVVAKLMWILARTRDTGEVKSLFYKNVVDDILYVEE